MKFSCEKLEDFIPTQPCSQPTGALKVLGMLKAAVPAACRETHVTLKTCVRHVQEIGKVRLILGCGLALMPIADAAQMRLGTTLAGMLTY